MDGHDLYRAAKIAAEKEIHHLHRERSLSASDARKKWNEEHWWVFCSEKLLEHVTGKTCYHQFDRSRFGILSAKKDDSTRLLKKHDEFKRLTSSDGSSPARAALRDELFAEYDGLLGR